MHSLKYLYSNSNNPVTDFHWKFLPLPGFEPGNSPVPSQYATNWAILAWVGARYWMNWIPTSFGGPRKWLDWMVLELLEWLWSILWDGIHHILQSRVFIQRVTVDFFHCINSLFLIWLTAAHSLLKTFPLSTSYKLYRADKAIYQYMRKKLNCTGIWNLGCCQC